jgi:hypothetical protein
MTSRSMLSDKSEVKITVPVFLKVVALAVTLTVGTLAARDQVLASVNKSLVAAIAAERDARKEDQSQFVTWSRFREWQLQEAERQDAVWDRRFSQLRSLYRTR